MMTGKCCVQEGREGQNKLKRQPTAVGGELYNQNSFPCYPGK